MNNTNRFTRIQWDLEEILLTNEIMFHIIPKGSFTIQHVTSDKPNTLRKTVVFPGCIFTSCKRTLNVKQ